MEYIKRHITTTLYEMLSQFKVVLVTGPRQVGKSTLLRKELAHYEYVTLDDMVELELARNEPALFFKNHWSQSGEAVLRPVVRRWCCLFPCQIIVGGLLKHRFK